MEWLEPVGRVARRLLVLPVLVLSAWLGACDKVPLTAPSGTTIRLYTNTQVLPLNGTAQITASVLESGGWPVQNGTVVTFTTSLGSVTPAEATTTDGKVTVIFNAGSVVGHGGRSTRSRARPPRPAHAGGHAPAAGRHDGRRPAPACRS